MPGDKYSAVWVSHTSINDFLECPRAYYLKHIYRDPKTGHKIKLISPPLSLGQIVHEIIESLSFIPVEDRLKVSLVNRLHLLWPKIAGKSGGFTSLVAELSYKKRGEEMLLKLMKNPGPLLNQAVKIKMELPYFWLSEKDNLILCGKIDWLEYLPDTDSVHIIDFKTSKGGEKNDSLQLPIYYLLARNCQRRHISRASYWYLGNDLGLTEVILPDADVSREKVMSIAKKIKLARQLNIFKCPHKSGCRACRPMELIIKKEAEFVGVDEYRADVYMTDDSVKSDDQESEIL